MKSHLFANWKVEKKVPLTDGQEQLSLHILSKQAGLKLVDVPPAGNA